MLPMSASVLRVELPESLSEEEARTLFAIKLYETGKVSLGQAARMAGFSKRAFLEVLGHHRIPVFDYPAEELRRELEP